jgi:parallel beta-helix repeat protein/predicted outer membrane repeat protein
MAAVAWVSIGLPGLSLAATLNVPADYPTIQACIDAAVSGVDECVAAPGTYHETINFLGKAITLRSSGGADVTTIDATGIGGSVVTCVSSEGPETILDGFTITGGTGTYEAQSGVRYGGGMYNANSSPTVTNCTFSGNTNFFTGGGMYNDDSSPTVTNCTFSDNLGGDGAGMYNYGSNPTVTHCAFSGNVGSYGGAMLNSGSSPTVANCTFEGNTTLYSGGGMHNSHSNLTLTDCSFSGNTAHESGGGISNQRTNLTMTNCTFSGNTASYIGGGIANYMDSSTLINCTFSGNSAWQGGGIYSGYSNPKITSCTFSGNVGNESGGALYNYTTSNPTVTNCVLWGDSPQEIVNRYVSAPTFRFSDVQGGLPVGAVDGGGNINLDPMFVRSPDPGPDGSWDGVDDDYGDLRLRAGSPCNDAGDPGFVAKPGETDLEGHARVLCGRVDMGAYEFGIGDYDCDQAVDLTDFANWSACMTDPSATADTAVPHAAVCEAFDFNADLTVDLLDFAAFQLVFTAP